MGLAWKWAIKEVSSYVIFQKRQKMHCFKLFLRQISGLDQMTITLHNDSYIYQLICALKSYFIIMIVMN